MCNYQVAQHFGNNHEEGEDDKERGADDANNSAHNVFHNPISGSLATAARGKKGIDARLLIVPSTKRFLPLMQCKTDKHSHSVTRTELNCKPPPPRPLPSYSNPVFIAPPFLAFMVFRRDCEETRITVTGPPSPIHSLRNDSVQIYRFHCGKTMVSVLDGSPLSAKEEWDAFPVMKSVLERDSRSV